MSSILPKIELENVNFCPSHTGYIEVFMQGKCGRDTETTFELKKKGLASMAIEKIKILGAALELPAKQHC